MRGAAISVTCALLLLSCGPEEKTSPPDESAWECTEARDGWERCDEDSVIWCHGGAHGSFSEGHFHEGASCGADALECVELDDRTAACLDSSETCEPGWAECQDREARNCVQGAIASKRCSLTQSCQMLDSGARCVPKG